MTRAGHATRSSRVVLWAAATAVSVALTAAMAGVAAQRVAHDRLAPWVIGRAGGIMAYLLLVLLVLSGLVLSHPWRARWAWPAPTTRIRAHALLASLTAAFTVLHIVALGTDRYAGVGWIGALVPMSATYRPAAVTLGVVGLWSGLLAGATAALAGRLPLRLWWPLHKIAGVSLIACWLHGVYAGSDHTGLRWMYLASAMPVLCLALGRYAARTPRDDWEEVLR